MDLNLNFGLYHREKKIPISFSFHPESLALVSFRGRFRFRDLGRGKRKLWGMSITVSQYLG